MLIEFTDSDYKTPIFVNPKYIVGVSSRYGATIIGTVNTHYSVLEPLDDVISLLTNPSVIHV